MSTAGKVLTVLILLVMIGWVVVISAVTQLNVNWQMKIQDQDKQLKAATEAVAKANKDITDFTEKGRIEQVNTDRDIREIEGRILAAERRQTFATESLARLKYQVADYLVAVEKAQTNLTTREAEKAKAIDDIAKKKDEIAKAQALNAELRDQLARLQDDVKRLLADNTEKAAKAAEAAPAVRRASERRPVPSS